MKRVFYFLCILFPMMVMLSGCGQSGPLYLPKPQPQDQNQTPVKSQVNTYEKNS